MSLQVQANFGPYKPVPPPKPLQEPSINYGQQTNFEQMGYSRQTDNRPKSGIIYQVADGQMPSHMNHNHILLTDQGHFHTHSNKFPIDQRDSYNRNAILTQSFDRNPSLNTNGKSSTLDRSAPYPPTDPQERLDTERTTTLPRAGVTQATTTTNHTNNITLRRREFNCTDGRQGQPMYRGSGRFDGQALDTSYMLTNGECMGKSPAIYASMRAYEPVGQANGAYSEHQEPQHPQKFRSQEAYQNKPNVNQNAFDVQRQISYDNQSRQNYIISQEKQSALLNQRAFQPQVETPRDCIAPANVQTVALSQLPIGQNQPEQRDSIRHSNSSQVTFDSPKHHQKLNGGIDHESNNDKNLPKKAIKKQSKLSNLISRFSKSDNRSSSAGKYGGQKGANNSPAEITMNGVSYGRGNKVTENNYQFKDKSLNASFRKAISYSSLAIHADHNNEHQNIRDRQSQDPRLHMSSVAVYNPEESKNFEEKRITDMSREVLNTEGRNMRAGSCGHIAKQVAIGQSRSHWDLPSQANMDQALPSDHAYPDLPMGGVNKCNGIRDSQISGGSDSGRGTGSSEIREGKSHDTSLESGQSSRHHMQGQSSGNESEWIDITEPELQNLNELMQRQKRNLTATPTLPPISPEASPKVKCNSRSRPRTQSFSSKNETRPDLLPATNIEKKITAQKPLQVNKIPRQSAPSTQRDNFQRSSSLLPACPQEWSNKRHQGQNRQMRNEKSPNKKDPGNGSYKAQMRKFEKIEDDLVSDAIPDINSVIDGFTEVTTDDDDATSFGEGEAYIIRKQLDGLEGMYSEVLKLLGTRKHQFRRRMHGSMSSLPSSIASAMPIKDRKSRVIEDRIRKTSRDPAKNAHKRFQRLESHVVTLARSVAHLSSEMRTQQLMFQEMEAIRTELGSLRAATVGNVGIKYTPNGAVHPTDLWDNLKNSNSAGLSNPGRVRKLTHFFGDEPPLVRLFLRKLGYEKYADIFEQERIGMLELPYLSEERLQKIGIPLGPRIRIIQEAQGPIKREGNLSVYVV